jgi:uncharacterized membrane protein YhhN
MWFIPFTIVFCVFAFLFILIRSIKDDELSMKSDRVKQLHSGITILVKIVPTSLAFLMVVLFRPSPSLFYLIMAMGLFFCILGDFAMEINILPGLGIFAIVHIIYIIAFLYQTIILGTTMTLVLITGAVLVISLIYAYFLIRYLNSSDQGLGKMKVPVQFYAILISLMLSTSVLFWLTANNPLGILIVLGALVFVTSDSLIGVREFHHHFKFAALAVMGTYYLAIFLLSMNILIFF